VETDLEWALSQLRTDKDSLMSAQTQMQVRCLPLSLAMCAREVSGLQTKPLRDVSASSLNFAALLAWLPCAAIWLLAITLPTNAHAYAYVHTCACKAAPRPLR
jgi:hypothetical protein